MSTKVLLRIASHHFVVTRFDEAVKKIIEEFVWTLVEWKVTRSPSGETKRTPERTFAASDINRTQYRFHIEMLGQFKAHLDRYGVLYRIRERNSYKPAKSEFNMNPKFTPREYQVPLIDYICAEGYKKVITLQTGMGKTATLLFAIERMGMRTVLVLSPKYFERWLFDMTLGAKDETVFSLRPGKDIMSVQGSKELRGLVYMAREGSLTASMIVISSRTYFNYLEDCKDEAQLEKYGDCHPEDFFKLLKVGVMAVDEGHENFHANFKLDLYTHGPKTITLSATLMPDDPFLKRMFQVLYPDRLRRDGGKYICYADMLSCPYSLDIRKGKLATSWRGRTDYSQLAYENALLHKNNKDRFNGMLEMLTYDIDELFLKLRIPEHKLLIFFDTVEMCVKVSERLSKQYPDLKVGKYTSEEPYEVLEQLEVIVATTKSADTGVDISKLQMCFCFVARGSSASNLQMFGRLRQLKTDQARPLFLYYYCTDITAHCNYHEKRQELFRDRTVNFNERKTNFVI